MLSANEKELSNLSYTNKDFGTIYPELLDLATKLSYKWDPAQSDESDPGVVLLKLAALMADKNNYNIDKNILELFPLSVTQLANARQLFEQLGYTMRYYQSATTDIELTLINPPIPKETDYSALGVDGVLADKTPEEIEKYWQDTEIIYNLPRFTTISNSDNDIVYTITEPIVLSTNGVTQKVNAIQGTANKYLINGEELITSANLDYNNRLYFTETDIAENGIFITTDLYNDWKRVDNLFIQELGTPCYKFGITEDGTKCYVEFPTDIDTLMGAGLHITYIRTAGLDGNIGGKKLSQFHVDTKGQRYVLGMTGNKIQDCTLTSENVYIKNPFAASNGKNPETIDDAYKGYQKVKNTFGTLVSLKDYSDFMISNKNVSNGYVCDRTNDVQSTYKILDNNSITGTKTATVVTKDPDTQEPNLNAFDLKTYALAYVDNVDTAVAFNETFRVLTKDVSTVNDMYNLLHDTETGWGELKSIQHDFKDPILNEIMMIKNKYHIDAKIIPQFKVTTLQETDIKNKVHTALYLALNSKEMNYGDPVEYDVIYDTIIGADPRIKALVLQDITYKTYAVYIDDNHEIQELQIDSNSSRPPETIEDANKNSIPNPAYNLWDQFRKEIYAKSVLAGKTQFLKPKGEFNHSLQEYEIETADNLYYVDTDTTISVPLDGTPSQSLLENENMIFSAVNLIDDVPYTNYCKFIYNFGSIRDPSSANNFIDKDCDYTMLNPNDYIIFFWKTDDDSGTPYSYRKYVSENTYSNTQGFKGEKIDTFSPTFPLKERQPDYKYSYKDGDGKLHEYSGLNLATNTFFINLEPTGSSLTGTVTGNITIGTGENSYTISANEFLSKLAGSDYVLSGTHQITTKTVNRIHINNKSGNGTDRIYWILNNPTSSNTYKLFDTFEIPDDALPEQRTQTYTLQAGEYLIYGNYAQTQLVMLSSGTKIERSSLNGGKMEKWEVKVIGYDEFISDPYGKLDGYWKLIDEGIDLYATEQQFYQIGPNYKVFLQDVTNGDETTNLTSIHFHTNSTVIYHGDSATEYTDETSRRLCHHKVTLIDDMNQAIVLPYRNKPEYSWLGKAILNLNCSPTKAQIIKAVRQRVIFYNNTTFDGTPRKLVPILTLPLSSEYLSGITGANKDKLFDTKLVTNREISLTGGTKVDVTTLDLISGEIIPLNAYGFIETRPDTGLNQQLTEIHGSWKYIINRTNSSVSLTLPPNTSNQSTNIAEYTLPIMLPEGDYVIPINVSNNLINENNLLKVTFHPYSAGVLPVYDDQSRITLTNILDIASPYNTIGTHLLRLSLNSDVAPSDINEKGIVRGYLTIFFNTNNVESDTFITLDCPYQYEYTHDDIESNFEIMLDEINRWNNYNGNAPFNYTYQVPESDLIENPLNGLSFVNSSHPYNPFTICQWNINDKEFNKIVIENKIK